MTKHEETPLVLAEGGVPCVRIVPRDGASPPEEYAVEELRRHLYAMIGAGGQLRQIEVGAVIVVNDRAAAAAAGVCVPDLGPEAFHLETRGASLFLLGGGPRGLLYGVYDLLEMLGCRWFTPTLTRIPRTPDLALAPLRKTAAPAFEFRDMFIWEGRDPAWWARLRMNGWFTPVPQYMGGHVDYGLFVHTFYTLLPPGEFFADHPEYYSEIDGVRRHEMGQICLTNPDVLRRVTERVLARMRANPRATIFSVSQNDWEGPCACPRCAAAVAEEGAQSGPLIRFVNAVAEATAREFPDNLIDTLAYWYTLDAPRHAVPRPNVRVRLCSIRCCQGHGYGACDHPESARFLRALNDWGRVTRQMYIWHYVTNFANYPLPMPNFDEIHANINLYRQRGVYGVFMQGCGENGGGAESMALRAYVIGKLLWNPEQPVWPLVDEFLAAYYGAAAPAVRRYLDCFHARVREDRTLHPSLYDPPTAPYLDGDTLAPADAALAAGEARVRGEERRRVRLLRDGLTYARLQRQSVRLTLEGDTYHSAASPADRTALDNMLRDFRRAGIRHIREGASLETTAMMMRNRFADHPVLWIGDDTSRAAVVPDLGGRLLEWHAGGRQWLAPPDPENTWQPYPSSGGYAEMAQTGAYSYHGGVERYRRRMAGDAVDVWADAGGLRFSRRYRLRDGVLTVESRVANRGTAPLTVGWGASLHLLAPGATMVTPVAFAWADLADGLNNARVFSGPQCPAGAWRVEVDGFRITQTFTGPVARAMLGKVERIGTLALDLRSDSRPLQPGEAIAARMEMRVERV